MGKFPYQSVLAALLLLALAFSIHDQSPAQAQDATRLSLQLSCETNSDQAFKQLPAEAGSACAPKFAKNNR